MGVATPHAVGRNQKFFAKAETTFATFAKPAATNALKVLKSEMSFKQERKDRMDARSSRSVLERITGKQEVTWSVEKYILPSGSAGTAPDDGDIWKNLLGVETVNASTSVVYTPSASQSALGSLSLVRHFNDVVMEALAGAVCESASVKLSGGDEPKVTFEGFAAKHIHTGYSTTSGALSGGESSISIQSADVYNFENGSVIQVGTSTNHEVTSGGGTSTLTLGTTISGAQSSGVAVAPYVPSETTAGSPIAGVLGSLTVDGTALLISSAEVNIKNNHKQVNDEAFYAYTTDYVPGFREVTGSLTVRARRDFVLYLGKRKAFTTRDLQLICGTTSGAKFKIDIDYAEFEFSALEAPEAEEVTFTLPFKALGSSGEDEITVTFF